MTARTAAERTLVARIAANSRWARTEDRTAATAPARKALAERFEREADPAGILDPVERARRADSARQVHMCRMALRSAQERARRRAKRPKPEASQSSAPKPSYQPDADRTPTASPPTLPMPCGMCGRTVSDVG